LSRDRAKEEPQLGINHEFYDVDISDHPPEKPLLDEPNDRLCPLIRSTSRFSGAGDFSTTPKRTLNVENL
jgi:hypothetical protein